MQQLIHLRFGVEKLYQLKFKFVDGIRGMCVRWNCLSKIIEIRLRSNCRLSFQQLGEAQFIRHFVFRLLGSGTLNCDLLAAYKPGSTGHENES